MSIISYAFKGNLKRFNDNLKIVSQKTGMSMWQLRKKFLHSFKVLGSGYSDFLNYELYNKTEEELLEYVSIKDQDKFYEIVSPSKYKTAFTIKPNFLKNFSKYISRDFFAGGTKEELEKFLSAHETFMIKPYDGLGGHKVAKMDRNDIQDIDQFFKKLEHEHLFLEEYVIQHEDVSKICPTSMNTIRIMTFAYDGKSEILFAAMRIGNGEAHVDNFHQGGMGVLVDIRTGQLQGSAYNKNLEYFESHPMTGVKFDGYQLPNWDKAKKLVLSASLENKHIHCVGWDVALTKDGATLIDGNCSPDYDIVQIIYQRGRKDMMRHCLEIINEKEGMDYKI